MEYIIGGVVIIVVAGTLFELLVRTWSRRQRAEFIDEFEFPPSIRDKVLEKYPHLGERQLDHVMHGLTEYFHLCNIAGKRVVAMPSQVVDVAWHEFILFTRAYQEFCDKALGRFLHHTPAEAMPSRTVAQEGIKTAWRVSCHREHIHVQSPHTLPLLFAMDSKLKIPDGFKYSRNCKIGPGRADTSSPDYCASHIGCGSGCASAPGSSFDGGGDGLFGGDGGCGGCGGD